MNKKNILWVTITVLILLISLFSLYKYKKERLPISQFIKETNSFDMNYTLKAYKYSVSRGEKDDWLLIVNLADNKIYNIKRIYTAEYQEDINMKWLDNETVEINGIKLNIYKDYYNK